MKVQFPSSAFGQKAFVDIAFDIGLHAGPVFGVVRIDDSLGGAWRGFEYPAAPF